MKRSVSKWWWCAAVLALSACPPMGVEDAGELNDAGATMDAGVTDAGTADSGTMDAGADDAGTMDAGAADAGTMDAGADDAGTVDAGADDAGAMDAGADDAGAMDAGADDAGAMDAGLDAGTPDAGPPGTGRIDGVVTESLSHLPLAGALVEAGGRTATTSATGEFTLTQVPDGVPVQLRVRGPAGGTHSTTQREVQVPANAAVFITTELLPGCAVTVNLAADAGFPARACGAADSRVGLTLPAGGVVDATGAVVNDVRVELAVLPVALGGRVASDALAAFPGDMEALSSAGAPTYLESRGAVEVRLSHAQTGAPLQLATGRTAVVTFSASEASLDDGPVPAWYFDEALGRWREEGATTLVSDPVTGALMHRLEVQHFTFWNADQPATRTCITGRLVEPDGGVLGGGEVRSVGLDYIGQSADKSAVDGRFSVLARRSSEVQFIGAARLGTGVAVGRVNVRTNPDATCADVGDVVLDTAPLRGCVSGRVVDALGAAVADLDVVAHTASGTSRVTSSATGDFCVPALKGERVQLALSGAHQGLPVTGSALLDAAAGGAVCGGAGCLDAGVVTVRGFSCLTGQVLDGLGPVANAQVAAFTPGEGSRLTSAGTSGAYCLPVVQGATVTLLGFTPGKLVLQPDVETPVAAASCGGPGCGVVDLVLNDAACVRGVVTDNGVPLEGVRVDVSPVGGGRTQTSFTGAGGSFCARVEAGTTSNVVFSASRPGTRYFASAQVAAPAGPASCGATGCADAGVVALTGQSFSGCVRGRVRDSSSPFRDLVDVLNGNRVALLRPREDGSFCVDVPVATSLSLVDPMQRDNCVGLRRVPVDTAALQAGSCAHEATCLEAGELDFAAFCATS